MTKEMIKEKVLDIFEMSESELMAFGTEVSMSELDEKGKGLLHRAIEDRILQLDNNTSNNGCYVVNSDFK